MNDQYLAAQIGVLGSVLIDDRVTGRVIHRTRDEDYSGQYRTVFKAIQKLFLAGTPVDPITVNGELGDSYGGLLRELMELTPTAANVDHYIGLTLEQAQLLRVKEAAQQILACRTMEEAGLFVSRLNRSIGDRPSVRVVTMAEGIKDFYERQKTTPVFLQWGFEKLDKAVMAEREGDFVVVGGYPSAGKTALSVQMAWTQAKNLRVGYFSLETKPEKLIDRTVAMVTGIDFGQIKRHQMDRDNWNSFSSHAVAMSERNLSIIQSGGLSVADIQALSLAGRYDVIYIDYLQLIRGENIRMTDFERVSQISMDLHTMAQTTGITVVALSQLTRPAAGKDANKAPTLHSLRQSGQIEQDADVVLLLYKENADDPNSKRHFRIAKNKEGEAGGILPLQFDGKTQRFTPVDGSKAVAGALARTGRAAKRMGRMNQTSMFKDLPGPDPDDPWKEENNDSRANSTS